ncbi:MAG: acyltransferase family protein [Solirubrobacteraceae bacterium]
MIEPPGLVASEAEAPNLVPPPGNPRFPLFDALRAVAALSVFAGHTVTGVIAPSGHRTLFVWAVALADQGVVIFFLISGFLLYRPFLVARRNGRPMRVGSYAKRRFLRIVPAYWAALTIFIAAGFVSGVTTHNWWIFYGFGQIYSPNNIGSGIGAAWTLCIEVTFYAALPLFAFLAARLGAWVSMRVDVLMLVVLAAASLAFRGHYGSFVQAEKVSTLAGTFFWFALGMGLAIASVALEGREPAPGQGGLPRRWPVLSWGAAVLLFVAVHEFEVRALGLGLPVRYVLIHVLYGLAALFVLMPGVFGVQEGGLVRRALGLRTLAWIGLISYAFYLYHSIVIAQLDDVFGGVGLVGRYLIVAVCAFGVTVLCAAASYYALERPMMLLGRSSRTAVRGTVPPAGGSGRELL